MPSDLEEREDEVNETPVYATVNIKMHIGREYTFGWNSQTNDLEMVSVSYPADSDTSSAIIDSTGRALANESFSALRYALDDLSAWKSDQDPKGRNIASMGGEDDHAVYKVTVRADEKQRAELKRSLVGVFGEIEPSEQEERRVKKQQNRFKEFLSKITGGKLH